MSPPQEAVSAAVTRVARQERGRLVALLAGRFGDLDLADESVQDAFEEALRTWPERGVPDQPAAWLMTVAGRKAIDRTRRAASARRRTLAAAPELQLDPPAYEEAPAMVIDQAGIRDDQLRLVLLCCHPALSPEAQVALTLRLVGGLTTSEIAAAYVLPEATVAQRVVRAKRKISAARIPFVIPAAVDDRIEAVLQVLYLVFNEGYLTHGTTSAASIRVDLTDEAIRLNALMVELAPDSGECRGLLALQLFHRARLAARLDRHGDLVLLDDQDRSRWDLPGIEAANRVLGEALAARPGPFGAFTLQAVIAGFHANARTSADTDWTGIVTAYDQLLALRPSPVVALNRAVAIAMADGPRVGLRLLEQIEGLERYHLWQAARAELMLRAGDPRGAAEAFHRAHSLATNPAELRHLERRIAALPELDDDRLLSETFPPL